MFSRNFMKQLHARKYGLPTAPHGNLNSNIYLATRRDIVPSRMMLLLLMSMCLFDASNDFVVFYQIFGHLKPLHSTDIITMNTPKAVLAPNMEVIEGFKQIHKAKEFIAAME